MLLMICWNIVDVLTFCSLSVLVPQWIQDNGDKLKPPVNNFCIYDANTPHNPCRFADTIGLVMERKRPKDSIDRLRWFCPNTEAHAEPHLVREVAFHCTDLGTQLKPFITEWMENEDLRKCSNCGTTAPPS
ncbi:3-hydroxyanthranilic acid dioxygenase [Puccinia graminis f. sp. tritici]|uniref:3-hydroxyanthranilic acid dioxygenase n=1 Tax=Puccinia graminis f. sp. tritici TaxID=56615 RepID=A0A5B0QWX1_PUCGR|nr:3-hydroxyanthranilic acid dioxygenase [Puccinia graminis f. sp. tritici]